MKRKSLAELQEEDAALAGPPNPKTTRRSSKSDLTIPKSEKIITKSDFEKLSITVDPELFEFVDELSRTRRRNKQTFTFSAIIRDALRAYKAAGGK